MNATSRRKHPSPPHACACACPLRSLLTSFPSLAISCGKANEDGQPLEFKVGDRPIALFYADVEAAKTQLAGIQKQSPDLTCDLMPVGLGSAFKLSCQNKAMVVPGLAELVAAGAPEDAQPLGQELPLFACMKMSREREGDDGPVVPLFMSFADCDKAVKQVTDAAETDEETKAALEISCLSLASVVEQLAGLDEPASSGAFAFEAASASLQHIEAYVGKGVYWRPVDEDE
jgi:hypothetical protein